MSISINHTTRSYPQIAYKKIKDDILGRDYYLELNFVGDKKAKDLNIETRGADYVPNVLSFPLDAEHGEIYINPNKAKQEAPAFSHTQNQHIGFLFIHGLLHLKGYDHGQEMEKQEQKYMKKYFKK